MRWDTKYCCIVALYFLRLEEALWFSVFIICERENIPEFQGINKVCTKCFSD